MTIFSLSHMRCSTFREASQFCRAIFSHLFEKIPHYSIFATDYRMTLLKIAESIADCEGVIIDRSGIRKSRNN